MMKMARRHLAGCAFVATIAADKSAENGALGRAAAV